MYDFNWAREGWRCPSCQKIWAPATSGCPYCNSQRSTFASTNVNDSDWWEKFLKQNFASIN